MGHPSRKLRRGEIRATAVWAVLVGLLMAALLWLALSPPADAHGWHQAKCVRAPAGSPKEKMTIIRKHDGGWRFLVFGCPGRKIGETYKLCIPSTVRPCTLARESGNG